MYFLSAGCVLLGILLAQFFSFHILIPMSALLVIVAVTNHIELAYGFGGLLLEIVIVVTCLQVGYLSGLAGRTIPMALGRLIGPLANLQSVRSTWPGHRRQRLSVSARGGAITGESSTAPAADKAKPAA